LAGRVEQHEDRLRRLEEQAREDSRTSSRPPSLLRRASRTVRGAARARARHSPLPPNRRRARLAYAVRSARVHRGPVDRPRAWDDRTGPRRIQRAKGRLRPARAPATPRHQGRPHRRYHVPEATARTITALVTLRENVIAPLGPESEHHDEAAHPNAGLIYTATTKTYAATCNPCSTPSASSPAHPQASRGSATRRCGWPSRPRATPNRSR
jgi:hypothetical protein